MRGRAVPIVALAFALVLVAALIRLVVRSAPDDVAAIGSRPTEESVVGEDASGAELEPSSAEPRRAVAVEPDVTLPSMPVSRADESVATSTAAPPPLQLLVIDESGLPVREALVELTRGSYITPFETGMSDEGGRVLARLAEVGDRVAAVAGGFETTRTIVPTRPWPEPMVVVLARGTPWLAGVVVDEGGIPVAGVAVTLEALSRTFRTSTGAEGRFVFTGPRGGPPPEAALAIESPDHCFLPGGLELPWSLWIELGWPRLVVKRWAKLDLIVEDAAGAVVGDATVVVRHPPEMREVEEKVGWLPGGGFVGFPRHAEPQGPDGQLVYALKLPPGYPWWVEVEHGAVGHERFQIGALAPGERAVRTVRLSGEARSPRLAFVVRDEQANPISGASAIVSVARVRSSNRSYERADAQGRFEIDPPGYDWTIAIHANGFGAWKRAYAAGFSSEEPIDVVLEHSDVGIEVTVLDHGGGALEGVHLSVSLEGDPRGDQVGAGATDAAGLFAWKGLDPTQTYRVEIGGGSPGSYLHRPVAQAPVDDLVPDPSAYRGVHAGATRIEFRMVPAGSIAGIVADETAIGTSLILSNWESAGATGHPIFGQALVIGSDGRFAFVGLPPGHYRLWGDGLGTSIGSPSRSLDLAQGEHVTDIELRAR
jgi:hypothetical protein